MNRTGSKILHGLLLATSGLVGSTLIASTAAIAGGGPTGGTVAVGSATIINASPTQTVVNQSSKKALINWNSFSIPTGSSVKFNQPNSKSLAVNRVTGPNASTIDGQLLANGNVWLINANGVLFGKGSQVNVGALLATTSDLSDDDFKKGNYSFQSAANPNAGVVNKGTITAGPGGSVVLSAPNVSNEGLIHADLGTVVLGGANAFTVDMTGDNLLRYEITAPVATTPRDANGNLASALVSNSGAIMAAGGHVMMTARAARNIENNVINNTGMVEATTVSSHNGEIDLDAGPDGTVNDSGTLSANGTAQGQIGGAVNVTGGTVNIADGAAINASGNVGGGTIQIGGGLHGQGTLAHAQRTIIGKATINADATSKGNGGTVAVWSDGETSFAGSISAKGGAQGGNGGQVETSGPSLGIAASAKVDTSAPLGLTGDWLLDPAFITITSCGSDSVTSGNFSVNISPTAITNALNSSNVTLEAGDAGANSTITVDSSLSYSSSNTLSLLSEGNITVNANIQNSGSGNITLVAGWDGSTTNFASLAPSSGAYGAAGGDVTIGGEYANGDIFVGSDHGITTVAGSNVTVSAIEGNTTIGYGGAGGGDINVFAKTNISLAHIADDDFDEEGESTLWASIGNGDGATSGSVTGNITLIAGANTEIVEADGAYLGNFAANGSAATGNVTVITNSGNLDGGYFTDDLGSGAGSGGNVFVGFTGTSGTYSLGGLGSYNSANTFTWAAAANLDVKGSVQNSGTGAINLIAGWDGTTTNLGSLANSGTYGNNQGVVTIDGASGFDVSVGSKSGKTTVLGYDVDVNANLTGGEGNAQIGYNGTGATGAIDVRAVHDIAVVAGDSGTDCTECNARTAYAQIGNGGAFVTGSESGDISIRAGGNLTISGGQNTFDYAQIGNGGDAGSTNNGTAGDAGNITVTVGGGITVQGGDDYAQIGNGGWGSNGSAGNISVTATGNISILGGVSSPWGYAQIGNGGQSADGNISGEIQVNAGGALTLTAGNNGMYAQIGNGGDKATTAGSKSSGNISITAGSLSLVGSTSNAGTDGYAQIGNTAVFSTGLSGSGVSSGNINVNVTGATTFTTTAGQGHAWIGNTAEGGLETGAVSILSGTFNSDNENNDDIKNFVVADLVGGNLTIGVTSAGASLNIGDQLDYSSANNLTLLTAGNLTISGGIQNAGSGNILLVTGWNPNVAPANVLTTTGSYGNGTTGLTLGGSSATADSMIGSAFGTTTVLTKDLNISAVHGTAGLGFEGVATGNIVVNALGNIAAVGQGPSTFALIGNLGIGNQAVSGNITIADSGSFTLTNAVLGNFDLGNATVGGNIRLTASSLSASGASVLSGNSAAIALTGAGASVGSVANPLLTDVTAISVLTNNGSAYISAPQNGLSVGVGGTGINLGSGNLVLNAGGAIDQTAAIGASGLTVTATGAIALNNSGNSFATAMLSSGGNAVLYDAANLILSGASIGGTLTLASGGSIGQSGAASAGTLAVTASGALTLTNSANNFATVALTSGGDASVYDAADLSIAGAVVGGNLTLAGGGSIGQTAAIKAASVTVSATNGDITLNNAANAYGAVSLNVTGSFSASIVDTSDLTVGNVAVGGNLTVRTKGDLTFAKSIQLQNGSILAIAGWDGTATGATTNGYGNNGGDIFIGGANAAGGVAIGSASGATTLAAGNVTLSATNGYAQIGYHGGGSGAINLLATGNVALNGGGSAGYFAQIGDGGYKVSGSSSEAISVIAGGDIGLNAGAGQEAYAQIGNGGAESNSNSSGYNETGLVTVSGKTVTLAAGSGVGSYAQIGHGGYKSGQALNGIATLGGNIAVNAVNAIRLIGGGVDGYAQIGQGGDFLNNGAANGSSGTISGDIAVAVATPNTHNGNDPLTLTAGTGANSFAQIGNGGQGENIPAAGANVTFTISGNVTVADLTLTGSNTGANGYAQIGNGDASKTGFGNVTGQVALGQGTAITYVPGTAPGSSTGLGNATGTGTVTGTLPANTGVDAGTQGSVASITQNSTTPTNFNLATVVVTPEVTLFNFSDKGTTPQGPTPLDQLADNSNSEGEIASDSVSQSVGESLGEGKTIYVTSKTLIPGMLKQIVTLTRNNPNGIPPADEDYSSWGNEALWRW